MYFDDVAVQPRRRSQPTLSLLMFEFGRGQLKQKLYTSLVAYTQATMDDSELRILFQSFEPYADKQGAPRMRHAPSTR